MVYFSYHLQRPGTAFFEIFNPAGERVASIREMKNGNGVVATTRWDANGFATGVYLVRLRLQYTDGGSRRYSPAKVVIYY